MFQTLQHIIFEELAYSARRRLDFLWPSRDKTNPTEENIIVTLAEAASGYGYPTYAEFPILDDAVPASIAKSGPIDLVLLSADLTEIVLVEAKTGQTRWRKQVLSDFEKLSCQKRARSSSSIPSAAHSAT